MFDILGDFPAICKIFAWVCTIFALDLHNISICWHKICLQMDRDLPKIPVICLSYIWDIPGIYLRYTWDILKIYLRCTWDVPGIYLRYTWDIHEWDIPHVGKFSILIDSVSEWMSDMPGSRDAYASKNLIKLKTI